MRYKLHGVLCHHGESAGSGHHTVGVLHQNGDGDSGEAWLHIDDDVMSAVRHEDVFGGLGNEGGRRLCLFAILLSHCSYSDTMTYLLLVFRSRGHSPFITVSKISFFDTCHPSASNCGPYYFIEELAPCSISNFTISSCCNLDATSSGVSQNQSSASTLAPCSISKRAISTAP